MKNIKIIFLLLLFVVFGSCQAQDDPQPRNVSAKVCNLFPKLRGHYDIGPWGNGCVLGIGEWKADEPEEISIYIHYKNTPLIARMKAMIYPAAKALTFAKLEPFSVRNCADGEMLAAAIPADPKQTSGMGYEHCGKFDVLFEYKGVKGLAMLPEVISAVSTLTFD